MANNQGIVAVIPLEIGRLLGIKDSFFPTSYQTCRRVPGPTLGSIRSLGTSGFCLGLIFFDGTPREKTRDPAGFIIPVEKLSVVFDTFSKTTGKVTFGTSGDKAGPVP